MQLSWRRLSAREIDHELLWGSVSLVALAGAAAWFAAHLPWPRCIFHTLTGFPCLTCGATRSAIQFFHGHFASAWTLNPLAFCTLCSMAVFDLYALIVLMTRAPRVRILHLTAAEKNLARAATIALLALNWIYLLRH